MDTIHIQHIRDPRAGETAVEIVERKGLGHPDTICDAVMEHIAQALSRAYRERFGTILPYNCDKGLLVAGQVARRFGGGSVVEPMRLIIGDRATTAMGERCLDVREIAVDTARAWFRDHLRHVDPEQHLRYQVELKPGSEELTRLFHERAHVLGANDTSAAVGYAPLSETERLVLATERYLNSPAFKARFPETGEDVKVLGVRAGLRLDLTVAMPLLDRYVLSEKDYFRRKEAVHEALLAHLRAQLWQLQEVALHLNTLDRPGAGLAGMYLSVLGTSAEDADSGEVGRGNQVNGLIALNRPRGAEAAAGKNPVSHAGKIYSVLAHQLANKLHTQISTLQEVVVWLCSRIGTPIDQPQMISVHVHLQPGTALADVITPIRQAVQDELSRIAVFCQDLAEGCYAVY
jgi:S-adenosylmethionine synthetase